MLYNYKQQIEDGMSEKLEIHVVGEKENRIVEFFDGIRLDPASIPEGKHMYHTRHNDDGDWSTPVTVQVEERGIMVNFCGSIVTDEPINITEETEIDFCSFI